jgi:hypothetical protein
VYVCTEVEVAADIHRFGVAEVLCVRNAATTPN